jgi:hypothetical protein
MTCTPQWYQKSTRTPSIRTGHHTMAAILSVAVKLEEIAAVACFGFSDGRPAFNKHRLLWKPQGYT